MEAENNIIMRQRNSLIGESSNDNYKIMTNDKNEMKGHSNDYRQLLHLLINRKTRILLHAL
ncbi:hypothetical protein HYE03_02240 [Mycoplasmopsis bovis]|nr:hypothetical protein [Mycoplasmopsis bovis]QQH28069.1 hypothetical protein HYE03_02240 [Mycoplasmopsis bovis]